MEFTVLAGPIGFIVDKFGIHAGIISVFVFVKPKQAMKLLVLVSQTQKLI